ncbi:YoaK family protein [Mycobacterium sp. ML4]
MILDRASRPRPSRGQLGPQGALLAYSGSLAFIAGFVNAVALLLLAFPVGNLTGVTTQLGMTTANPWLYEEHVLAAILIGFWGGAVAAGAILGNSVHRRGPHHAALLATEAVLLVLAALGVEETQVKAGIEALGIEQPVAQAFFAAAALGMQNGLTSSFRGMAVRTTHFTGTVTDLGLMIGRARRQGFDKWKAAILALTLLLFLAGGAAGLLIGTWLGGYALAVPAALCAALAAANARRRRTATTRLPALRSTARIQEAVAVSA